jgi:5'-nucleotidase
MRFTRSILFVALVALASGCTLLSNAGRSADASGAPQPFWCAPVGGTALSSGSCIRLSAQLDRTTFVAQVFSTAGVATADGAVGSPYVAGVGAAYRFRGPTARFDFGAPDTLLYDAAAPGARIAGIEYNVLGATAPAGFEGPNDHWVPVGNAWRLRVWIVRPFQDQRNVFADSHPCLAATGAVHDVTAACYTATHPRPLEVLVSNDDGYSAAGIDTVVETLRAMPNVHITVSAPATNQSGVGSSSTDGPVSATDQHTASGYPVWAVAGFPVDAVRYALRTRHVNPDLVVSGSNIGQNIGPLVAISGTVGAAREAAQNSIPVLAISQGLGSPPDFPQSALALRAWFGDFLDGRTGRPVFEPVTNINVPTCTTGSVRGTVRVPTATDFNGRPLDSNCTSTVTTFADDVDAFGNGYVSVSTVSARPGSGT